MCLKEVKTFKIRKKLKDGIKFVVMRVIQYIKYMPIIKNIKLFVKKYLTI